MLVTEVSNDASSEITSSLRSYAGTSSTCNTKRSPSRIDAGRSSEPLPCSASRRRSARAAAASSSVGTILSSAAASSELSSPAGLSSWISCASRAMGSDCTILRPIAMFCARFADRNSIGNALASGPVPGPSVDRSFFITSF